MGEEQRLYQKPEEYRPTSAAAVRQDFAAYVRCMWSLLWTAFRHPFKATVIDWSTGQVLSDTEATKALRSADG